MEVHELVAGLHLIYSHHLTNEGREMSKSCFFRVGSVVCSISMAMIVSASASAESVSARLARIDGTVMVATDATNVRAVEGMQLQRGDRLMVMDGGSAMVEYSDGCNYSVNDEMLLTIAATSACARGVRGVESEVSAAPPAVGDTYPTLSSVIYGGASASVAPGVASTGGVAPAAAGSLAWVPAGIAGGVAVGVAAQASSSSGSGSSISP